MRQAITNGRKVEELLVRFSLEYLALQKGERGGGERLRRLNAELTAKAALRERLCRIAA